MSIIRFRVPAADFVGKRGAPPRDRLVLSKAVRIAFTQPSGSSMPTNATGAGVLRSTSPQNVEIGDHHRQAGHRRLDRRQSECLPARRKYEEVGCAIEVGDVGRRQGSEKMERAAWPRRGLPAIARSDAASGPSPATAATTGRRARVRRGELGSFAQPSDRR